MSYGKWIGGGLGWAFGGPIGAILGFAIGSMFDSAKKGKYEHGRTRSGDFGVSLLILSAAVMKADGKVLKSEVDFVKRFFVRQFGVEETRKKMLLLKEILKQNIPVQDVCLQIRQYMDIASRLQLMHFLFGTALADGHIDTSEINVIHFIAGYLGISQGDYDSIKAMFVKDTESAYKILEIYPDASDQEVKAAYRKMAVKYHPDKVAHLGGKIQKVAKEKFQQLNNAYGEIKKERMMV
jgi:DnaJ like chaperone protein